MEGRALSDDHQGISGTLSCQTLPDKHAGDKEQQRHEERFVERHNQIKTDPALLVYNRTGSRDRVLKIDESGCGVGENRVMTQHEDNCKCT
jgi:hypothetical protein